ncbi:Up-regulated during septation-domain-containing protein [Tricladium varicosporioides]|nr:Up-regulated during septation-domain-containing protein [Hymenoscyphus varicosporioides]
MAHIADFMVDADTSSTSSVGLNNYIARELSPSPPQDAATEVSSQEEKEKQHVWRMHQPSGSRKLHLFPSKEKLSIAAGRKSPDQEKASTQAMGQNGSGEKDRSLLGSALGLKPKEQKKEQTLIRRRKVSVPELGPMTTVQEVAMDSPTIPGRPPLHERSISAPGNSWRQHVFGESMLSCITGPALDENAELGVSQFGTSPAQANSDGQSSSYRAGSASPKHRPLSPKSLAPLVIPSTSAPQPQRLGRRPSNSRLRSGSTPPDVPPKSARFQDRSPYSRNSPFTPGSASTTNLSTAPTSINSTPISALPERQTSPKPWTATSATGPGPSPMGHSRGQSEAAQQQSQIGKTLGHRRGESEASIMDRGRPKKRSDGSPIKRQLSKRSPAEEQKAFESLPQGIRATEASTLIPTAELESLRKQAIGQASRFEVLNSKDVESLSRELRGLDERCEYLRKTHRSLRSGRRNLHDRICTYLRSPRVARFSHESILKQEEALSELDSSIDDWVSKLEQAENRRTRVRQKLLEHVAAALIIQPPAQYARGEETPPRSPTKSQSPVRVVEEVRVTSPASMCSTRRGGRDCESIRIYADSDVYALLADVEEEINRMGEQGEDYKAKEHERALEQQREEERRKENVIAAGITLNAVAFSGVPIVERNYHRDQTFV